MLSQNRNQPYSGRLFAAVLVIGVMLCVAESAYADNGGGPVNLWPYIKPTGLITLSLVLVATGLAALRKIRPRVMLTLHKIFAALAVVSALCHATLVFLSE